MAEPRVRGQDQGPFLGEFPARSALPASPRPLSRPLLVWSRRCALPASSLLPLLCVPPPPGWRRLGTRQSPRTRRPGGHPRRGAYAPVRGEVQRAAHREGTWGSGPARGSSSGLGARNPATHLQQPGLAMAAPRPSPAISVSVSAPAFYAPQKKFAPVVAPKPKVNPFRPGDSEPLPASGAQRAQMGRVGEIPLSPPEGMQPCWGGWTPAGSRLGAVVLRIWGCLEMLQRRGQGAATLSRADVLTSSWSSWLRARVPGTGPSPSPGGGRRECGTRIFPSGSVFQSVTGAAPLLRRAPGRS